MLRLIVGGSLALAALGGCDGGGAGTEAKKVTAASPYLDQLRGLSEMNKGLALRRAVQDSKQRCKKVVSAGEREPYKNMSLWNLKCTDGEYALFIAPSGDVQVRSCADVKTLGLPQCRFEEGGEGEKKS